MFISMRVILQKDEQIKFIKDILSKISVNEAAKLCGLSERTIRDWRRAKFSMDLELIEKLCKKVNIVFPKDTEIKEDYWYVAHGSSAGGLAVLKKYGRIGGDPDYRKKKWHEWYEKEKVNNPSGLFIRQPISKPTFSEELAEFVGILLGDGGISEAQVHFTFHSEDDREYAIFVVNLIKKLFNVPVGSCRKGEFVHAITYYISRKELVCFCTEKLGLKQGNKVKQQVDIPEWVKNNKSYAIACVRGLVDTDGCIFNHKYKVNGKIYKYKKLSFVSASRPLLSSVYDIMQYNNLHPRLARKQQQGEVDLRLDAIQDMEHYFEIFGSHNPKHLNKYFK